jgi:hypothetical protein
MNPIRETAVASPKPEEVTQRIAEYRQVELLRQIPAQVVYQPPQDLCPWPNCGYRIAGARFNLNQQGDPGGLSRLMKAWWSGSGLVGLCPKCRRLVLFGVTGKRAVNIVPDDAAVLPDDWEERAHLVVVDE